jgi:hypothetical protein
MGILCCACLIRYRKQESIPRLIQLWPRYRATCQLQNRFSRWNCEPMRHVLPTPSPDSYVIRPSQLLGLFATTAAAPAGNVAV